MSFICSFIATLLEDLLGTRIVPDMEGVTKKGPVTIYM